MEITEAMVAAAREAYSRSTGAEKHQLDGWIDDALKSALSAAISYADVSVKPKPVSWQPIETAPRDGTQILGVAVDNPVVPSIVCFVDGEWQCSDFEEGRYIPAIWPSVTHWMPLPEPPKGGDAT